MSCTTIYVDDEMTIDLNLKVKVNRVSNWGESQKDLKERFTSAVNDGTIHRELKEFLLGEIQGDLIVQPDFYDFITIEVSE